MYIALLTTAGIFFAIRFLALRCIARPAIANASGLLGVLLFLIGIWVGAGLFGATPTAQVTAPSPVAAVSVAAPSPTPAPVDYSALPTKAMPASGAPILASIDSVNTDRPAPPASTQFAFVRGSTIVLGGWAASSGEDASPPADFRHRSSSGLRRDRTIWSPAARRCQGLRCPDDVIDGIQFRLVTYRRPRQRAARSTDRRRKRRIRPLSIGSARGRIHGRVIAPAGRQRFKS